MRVPPMLAAPHGASTLVAREGADTGVNGRAAPACFEMALADDPMTCTLVYAWRDGLHRRAKEEFSLQ